MPAYISGQLQMGRLPSDVEGKEESPDSAIVFAKHGPLIVDFENAQDPSIAVNWKPRKKWTLIFTLSSMTFITYAFPSPFGIHTQLIRKKRPRLSNVCSGGTSAHGRLRFKQ